MSCQPKCRVLVGILGVVGVIGLGCGQSQTLNTAPLTEEQKQKVKMEDQQIYDEEATGGSGVKAVSPKKGR